LSADQISSFFDLLALSAQIFSGDLNLSTVSPTKRRSRPSVFVGSSTEGLRIAQALQSLLDRDFDVIIWDQSEVFGLGRVTIEALESAVSKYDFGIFVFCPG
jgi:predicted nucleotide-binding protein